MPYLTTLEYKFEKLLSYLNSASLNLPKFPLKVSCKIKNQKPLSFLPKMPDIGVFWLQF